MREVSFLGQRAHGIEVTDVGVDLRGLVKVGLAVEGKGRFGGGFLL